MKPLDVISSVDFGYRLVWRERRYLLRLAAVPLLVKAICLLILSGLGWEQNYLRMGLVMLPSFFTEGWMLAHVTRLIFFDQRWPFRSSGDRKQDEAVLLDRAYGVMLGTMFYVVIKFLLAGVIALLAAFQVMAQADLAAMSQQTAPAEPSFLAFLAAVSFLVITAWGFRFMFLYIPAAAGITGDIIIRTKQGMLMSLQMMGIWLVSTVPFLLVLGMVGSALLSGTPTEGGAPVSLGAAWTLVQTVVSTLMAMVCTAAIAAALRNMIEKPRPSR